MAELIRLPRMSDTMTEGKIVSWHKKVGDKVKSGDVLAEIETDKAVMELESYSNGTLLYIANEKNSLVAVDAILAIIGKEGEDYKNLLSSNPTSHSEVQSENSTQTDLNQSTLSTNKINPADLGVTLIRMPLLSDTMKEGKIVKWNKKVGDKVKSDESIADVETDKATMEIIGYVAGTLLYIGVKEGDNVPVNNLIAIIGKENTNVEALVEQINNESKSINHNPISKIEENISNLKTESISTNFQERQSTNNERIKASPLAKQIARTKGIDLSKIKGSGEFGRIIKIDVLNLHATPQIANAPLNTNSHYEDVPLSQMRKTIAKRLSESKFSAPHFYLTMSVNMDNAIENRKKLNEIGQQKISFNDMVIKAVAMALKKHPAVNSSWLGDKIRVNYDVNIGIAVAIPDGLLVPVIRNVDTKTLTTISNEVKDFAHKAKNKLLQPKDWEGSTFTISNLGMFGIDQFTAIINPPDACILAVGGIQQQAIVKNGQVVPGNIMKLTLSCDHRAVDGATGAAFLQTLKLFLEEPMSMIL